MKLHQPVQLVHYPLIRDTAYLMLMKDWDFQTERLFRMPMSGWGFDMVSRELAGLGFPPISIWTVFARGPGGEQGVHADAYTTTERVHSALIVPVTGTQGSVMQWFVEDENTVMVNVPNPDGKSTLFRKVSKGIPQVLHTLEVTEPVLARVDVPHRAIAGAKPRAVVSIKFQGNPKLF